MEPKKEAKQLRGVKRAGKDILSLLVPDISRPSTVENIIPACILPVTRETSESSECVAIT